jgi:hypothetical protein
VSELKENNVNTYGFDQSSPVLLLHFGTKSLPVMIKEIGAVIFALVYTISDKWGLPGFADSRIPIQYVLMYVGWWTGEQLKENGYSTRSYRN